MLENQSLFDYLKKEEPGDALEEMKKSASSFWERQEAKSQLSVYDHFISKRNREISGIYQEIEDVKRGNRISSVPLVNMLNAASKLEKEAYDVEVDRDILKRKYRL